MLIHGHCQANNGLEESWGATWYCNKKKLGAVPLKLLAFGVVGMYEWQSYICLNLKDLVLAHGKES